MRFLILCFVFLLPFSGLAQSVDQPALRSMILVVDLERIDAETNFGRTLQSGLADELQRLSVENERIVEELNLEEQQLAEDRKTDDPTVFSEKADAFDEKVRLLRSEQRAKLEELQRRGEEERRAIYAQVIREIALERGAVIVIERRNAILVADSVDITGDVIARINGATAAPPEE